MSSGHVLGIYEGGWGPSKKPPMPSIFSHNSAPCFWSLLVGDGLQKFLHPGHQKQDQKLLQSRQAVFNSDLHGRTRKKSNPRTGRSVSEQVPERYKVAGLGQGLGWMA